jgi:hypothetical protein
MLEGVFLHTPNKSTRVQYVIKSMNVADTNQGNETLMINCIAKGYLRLRFYNQSANISGITFSKQEYSGYTQIARV